MFCRECGKEVKDKAVVCIHCGVAIDENFEKGRKSSKPYFSVIFASLNFFSVLVNDFSGQSELLTNDALWGSMMIFSTPSIILGIICVSKDYKPKKVSQWGLTLEILSLLLNIIYLN